MLQRFVTTASRRSPGNTGDVASAVLRQISGSVLSAQRLPGAAMLAQEHTCMQASTDKTKRTASVMGCTATTGTWFFHRATKS